MKAVVLAVGLMALLAPQVAHAQKIKLEIQVVEASTEGHYLDPRLKHIETDFKKKKFGFSSYKLVSAPNPVLDLKGTAEVPLPNGKLATFTAVGREPNGMIDMRLAVSGVGLKVDYSVANRGLSFFGAGPGAHPGSQIFMVIRHIAL